MNKNNDFFKNVIFFEYIGSTNDYLKKNNIEDKTVIYTFNQNKGRGRGQKGWVDIKDKNLALSFLLKPEKVFKNNIWYIAAASLALIDVIKQNKISNYWIKWPNDIYINKSKIAGILAETIWQSSKIKKIIIGIGINVNCTKKDFSNLKNNATSFYLESGILFDMNNFFIKYKECLSKWLLILLYKKRGIKKVKKCWLKYNKIINRKAEWRNQSKIVIGKIIKIEEDGTIILKTIEKEEKIISGEIELIE
jgi:BirA family biotin operon repressor/biotin-[acetyl-CoA-carboxylase] ligase